ncbi:MAG: threonylcarbamoyl-AMP synthase [Planctomycetes bacterium]|nr:threonylcarbamoyl-AMP synthase [Planctomycetota bacterium]
MAKRRLDANASLEKAITAAAQILEAGGVIIFPTETVYGIGVVSGNADALATLRRLKGRENGKPFQFLAADLQMAKNLGAVFPSRALKLARNYWPGPLTLVVADGTDSDGTLGIRIPDSQFVLALCRRLERPLIAASANSAGAKPPADADAADVFGDAVDLVVDAGPIVDGTPSTVVHCLANEYHILRDGAIGADAIDAAWNE